jgi:uncharacterized membrane protein YtjA (UPF0391 family)
LRPVRRFAKEGRAVIKLGIVFSMVALTAGYAGFFGMFGPPSDGARLLFVLFLALAGMAFVYGMVHRSIRN